MAPRATRPAASVAQVPGSGTPVPVPVPKSAPIQATPYWDCVIDG
jgi:hypothetical protein